MQTSKVVSITVAHQPTPELLTRQLKALRTQVDTMLIVDNGSDNATSWHPQIAGEENARLIVLPANAGIAAAQNLAIQQAIKLQATHILLMDHDSVPALDMVHALLEASDELKTLNIAPAVFGSVCIDSRARSPFAFVRMKGFRSMRTDREMAERGVVEADFLVASGSLIPMEVLSRVGLMAEKYFIDHVDTEWCLRARSCGIRIFGVRAARLEHRLGDRVVRVWLGRWREVRLHSPLRNYYMFRNTILMLRSAPMSWAWRMTHIYRIFRYAIFFAFMITPRCQRINLMLKGIGHGLRGRGGALK